MQQFDTHFKSTLNVHKTSSPKAKPAKGTSLGFGRLFTDHIFVSKYKTGKGWYSSEIKPYSDLLMDPAASVFHYGQALFEGLKAFRQHNEKTVVFRPQFNAERLNNGCQRLNMVEVPKELFVSSIIELLKIDRDWIPNEAGTSLYIRPTLIGSEGFLGVRPSDEYLFFIILSPVGSYYSENGVQSGVRIWVETEEIRAAPGGLGAIKAAANYASSLRAATLQKKNGFDQVLWLDAATKDQIEEVGTMNVFFVLKNEIVTPRLNGSILPGGVRECTLKLLREWELPVTERTISMTELKNLYDRGEVYEMFGTGTAAVITPVKELQYKEHTLKFTIGESTVASRLYNEITGIQYGKILDRHRWLTEF